MIARCFVGRDMPDDAIASLYDYKDKGQLLQIAASCTIH